MTPRGRMIMFFGGGSGMALLFVLAMVQMPGPDNFRNRYAAAIDAGSVAQRNVTDAVTAVNFDYRGFDTMGEEFILFVSVVGTLVLLRQREEKRERILRDAVTAGRDVDQSEGMQMWLLTMVGPKLLFGLYVVTHGALSPGGGFQGGVIIATAAILIYLGEDFQVFKRIMSHPFVEAVEAIGAGGYVLVGMLGWLWHREFLTNTLPLGKLGELTSGGTIALLNIATGLAVAGGFVIIVYAFLQSNLTATKADE